jgi:hypothetical protein
MLLGLIANIRLGWNSMKAENTLAYYDTATIKAVKSFIAQAPESYSQHFIFFVTYDCVQ